MKTCPKCKTSKPLDQYRKHCRNKDGLQNYCKICQNLMTEESRRKKRKTGRI